jgi:NitT/TauT family transport system ATP-binding protein
LQTKPNTPILEMRDLEKAFVRGGRRVQALEDVSLTMQEGEFVILIGPSGCGKSTLLHITGGLERPSSGEVLLRGEPVRGPGRDRGMVFQQATLFPWKTTLKNVSWAMEVAKVPKREAVGKARELLALVGLHGFEDSYPGELSGGMRQRAALARTLSLEPEIMLMDEPFGALDAQTREEMQEEFTRIWEQTRMTVIFVTHDVNEAAYLGDRVAVMSPRPGKITETVEIELPRPRDPAIKKSRQLLEYHNYLWDALHTKKDHEGQTTKVESRHEPNGG